MTRIPVLMYHSVSDSEEYGGLPSSCRPIGYRLTVSGFEDHLAGLREGGWSTVSLAGLAAAREGRGELPGKPVVLTFDDGYADNAQAVLPRLLACGFRATFFLSVSSLGEPGMMDFPAAARLLDAGMEIGSHGMGHRLLSGLAEPALRWELDESRRRLGDGLGTGIDFFSLPRGFLPPSLPELARAAGYRGLCTSRPGFYTGRTDPFDIPRFPVRSRWGRRELEGVLTGRGWDCRRIMAAEKIRSLLRRRFRFTVFAGQKR
ncbi:MAG: polysaccharide deacetylase family protein [PVC group bacterium]